jgi:hypothetical protein
VSADQSSTRSRRGERGGDHPVIGSLAGVEGVGFLVDDADGVVQGGLGAQAEHRGDDAGSSLRWATATTTRATRSQDQ